MPDRLPRPARTRSSPRRRPAGPAGSSGPARRRRPRPHGVSGGVRRDPPWLVIAGILAVLLALVLLISSCGGNGDDAEKRAVVPADPGSTSPLGRTALRILRADPEKQEADLTRRAEAGFANPLYRLVPGGAVASAQRVAAFRPLIEKVAKDTDEDPDVLEGIVYLESAGRPEVLASGDIAGAAGLTQIVAGTGTQLLGMKVDLARSKALTGRIARETRRNRTTEADRLRAARARIDERFDPEKSLRATAKYLDFARGKLDDRDDLAVASYHMGVGNLQNLMTAVGQGTTSYARMYFSIDPRRTPDAMAQALKLSDDSTTYLWRVGAAERIMKLYRDDRPALVRENELQNRKASSEDVLHPVESTTTFDDPSDLADAERSGAVEGLPRAAMKANGMAIDPAMGELAPRLKQNKRRYRALRPGALAGLLTIGAAVKALNGDAKPATKLVVTSSVRDKDYQAMLGAENVQATKALSQHTTGWAMDISRSYPKGDTAQLFQWTLSRLQALDLIAWVREPTAIHLTFSSAATKELAPVLRQAGLAK
ncbi:DUF5715 family protein [Patulibacter minatonensis]|uniref:DUF5715 family protein n=1 Tax=Patulibacter minatonensis TaxID=298163 RepID=UPI00047DCDF0|nr:transglycosylase SLT domain-containing protein [Patulibacter minatonensis]